MPWKWDTVLWDRDGWMAGVGRQFERLADGALVEVYSGGAVSLEEKKAPYTTVRTVAPVDYFPGATSRYCESSSLPAEVVFGSFSVTSLSNEKASTSGPSAFWCRMQSTISTAGTSTKGYYFS